MSVSDAAKRETTAYKAGTVVRPKARPEFKLVRKVVTDPSRDALLTDFGKTTLDDRYLLPGESYQDMFAREQACLRHREMAADRRRHYDSIESGIVDEPIKGRLSGYFRVELPEMCEPCLVEVTHYPQVAFRN